MALPRPCYRRNALALAVIAALGLVGVARAWTKDDGDLASADGPTAAGEENPPDAFEDEDDDDEDEDLEGPTLTDLATDEADAAGIHLRYNFTLTRKDLYRQGSGELWIGLDTTPPKIKLLGKAKTSKFEGGEITIVVETEKKEMYVLFKLPHLQEEQCLTYAFPNLKAKENVERLKVLKWRSRQVNKWKEEVAHTTDEHIRRYIDWTESYRLEYLLNPQTKKVVGMDLRDRREGSSKGSIVKTVRLKAVPWAEDENVAPQDVYRKPRERCDPAETVSDPVAEVLLIPPHRRSSALNDLLLVLAKVAASKKGMKTWPQLFILLSAVTVPGDVAVLIEDPKPPDFTSLNGVDFEYEATINKLGGNLSLFDAPQMSNGTVTLDLRDSRSFVIRDQEDDTKIGPVFLDLIADNRAMKLYANVNLTAQARQECIMYDYPKPNKSTFDELKPAAMGPFKFRETARLRYEDCGIFVAPLARDREIFIWVDMDSKHPGEILRAEVRLGRDTLRSVDVKHWRRHTGNVKVTPEPEWGCVKYEEAKELVSLGLNAPHKWSAELLDALAASLAVHMPEYKSSHEMHRFAVLEILGLAGDVNMVVQSEPRPPSLWAFSTLSFNFSTCYGQTTGGFEPDMDGAGDGCARGSFVSFQEEDRVSVKADIVTGGAIFLDISKNFLAIRVQPSDGPSCYVTSHPFTKSSKDEDFKFKAKVTWDGVEDIAGEKCNRFTYQGSDQGEGSVLLWYSAPRKAACAVEHMQQTGEGAVTMVTNWAPSAVQLDEINEGTGIPVSWKCTRKEQEDGLIIPDIHAAVVGMVRAAGFLGLVPPWATAELTARIRAEQASAIPTPVPTVPTPAPTPVPLINIFGNQLKSFGFSFSSRCSPSDTEDDSSGNACVASSTGQGQLEVDLVNARLFLQSAAMNVSRGIPSLSSQILLLGDSNRLYSMISMKTENYDRCWSVSVPLGKTVNPFGRATLEQRDAVLPGLEDPADQWGIDLGMGRYVKLFVSHETTLRAIVLSDSRHHSSATVFVSDWSTELIDEGTFIPPSNCESGEQLDLTESLAQWDLIEVFLPGALVPEAPRL